MLVDWRTMETLASVGAANFFDPRIRGQIDGTRSRRSPGSTLKPLVYALAIDQGVIHPLSILSDAPRRFASYAPENFDRLMDVNLRGALFFTTACVRAMLRLGAAGAPRSVITISSVSAEMASPERTDYCISKAGLSMAMKNLAVRLAPEGVAVFELRPGIIRTPMTAAVAPRYDARIAEGLVPALRWGEPEDVAAMVAALASGRLGFATGSAIACDGALSIPRL